jgi:F-type H+-transporting ATPase subunit epsilon|tara:strand:+ start:99 stop:479 length:381 start_codon:yes stop_codon:yes gene_type:complete
MSQEFKIEIISPDNSVYTDKTSEVVLPCFEGQITILKDHIPLITFLRPGLIEVDKKQKFYVEDGTVEFSDNKLLVLSTTVLSLKDFSKEKINSLLKDAEKRLLSNQISDKQKYLLNYKIDTLKQIN